MTDYESLDDDIEIEIEGDISSVQKTQPRVRSRRKHLTEDDDFISMGKELFDNMDIKMAIFLFIVGMIIFNDVFVTNVLGKVKNAAFQGDATNKGTMIQLLLLSICYIVLDLLVAGNYL